MFQKNNKRKIDKELEDRFKIFNELDAVIKIKKAKSKISDQVRKLIKSAYVNKDAERGLNNIYSKDEV